MAADANKSSRDLANERREEKLASIREQVDNGSLVIRQMTAEERKRNPPRPKPPGKRSS